MFEQLEDRTLLVSVHLRRIDTDRRKFAGRKLKWRQASKQLGRGTGLESGFSLDQLPGGIQCGLPRLQAVLPLGFAGGQQDGSKQLLASPGIEPLGPVGEVGKQSSESRPRAACTYVANKIEKLENCGPQPCDISLSQRLEGGNSCAVESVPAFGVQPQSESDQLVYPGELPGASNVPGIRLERL